MDKDFLTVINTIANRLIEKNLRLAVAESLTGGHISDAITNLPGSSRFFEMSVVSYSSHSKSEVLGIGGSIIKKFGMISEETAIAMARAIADLSDAEISLSTTGVAGPEPMEGKDVGLVYMAVSVNGRVESRGMKFSGSREEIKRAASLEALNFLYCTLDLWL